MALILKGRKSAWKYYLCSALKFCSLHARNSQVKIYTVPSMGMGMGNGMTERFNRTLLNMLGTLKPEQRQDWKSFLRHHAYNATRLESTGYSPFILMFGQDPPLPSDHAFGIELNREQNSLTLYVQALRTCLEESYKITTRASKDSQEQQKTGFGVKVRGATVQPGEWVLVKILAFDQKHKLSDKREEDPCLL